MACCRPTRRRPSDVRQRASAVGGIGALLLAGVASYPLWRRWCLNWGTAEGDEARVLAGDDLLAQPDLVSTRGVRIDAPPAAIWPWLVQMGPGRGGAYTYDWIENLFGLGMHSAQRVLPEFQDLAVGDSFRLGRKGPELVVALLETREALVLRSDDGNWVWAFVLVPDGTSTRLLSRNRIAVPGVSALHRALYDAIMGPGSLVMERKMLLGIKSRAERLAAATTATGVP